MADEGLWAKLASLLPAPAPQSLWDGLDQTNEHVRFRTSSPLVNITDEDIDRGINIAKSVGPLSTVRPYVNVPDSLMGYRKSGPQKGFDETNYPHTQDVAVTLPKTSYSPQETFADQVKGMNPDHALERAWRNWPDAINIQAK